MSKAASQVLISRKERIAVSVSVCLLSSLLSLLSPSPFPLLSPCFLPCLSLCLPPCLSPCLSPHPASLHISLLSCLRLSPSLKPPAKWTVSLTKVHDGQSAYLKNMLFTERPRAGHLRDGMWDGGS